MHSLIESPQTSNPYALDRPIDVESVAEVKRPIGTIILGVLLLLLGAAVCGQQCYYLISVYSSFEHVLIHPSYLAALTRDAITSLTAVCGAVGLFTGSTFGWWLSSVHVYWRLSIHSVLPLLGVATAQAGTPLPGQYVSAAFASALICLLIIVYLQKKNVISYFRIPAHRVIVSAVLLVACVCVGFSLDAWWWSMSQQ
ncbi:MAG: hypothetical protein ACYC6N_01390 [Pirellulaceae bacterium]